ncbi:MAG: hypothetical protein GWO20_06885 [Candidatus Korarchaeota archaeon]|nr:hypothetical protein [Candidatus Korarchaeota archaeon]NIW13661.1 hypothetical protein [Candidatus Thorarchaeota archaeon]
MESRGIQPQMRFPQFESFLKENRSFSHKSETAQKILKALKYLEAAFPDKCRYLRNRANVLSVCMLASRVIASGLDKGDPTVFGKFVEDFFKKLAAEVEKGSQSRDRELLRYQQAITTDSMGGNSIKARIGILTKRLSTFSSHFASLLGSFRDAEDEITKNISELASAVRELVYNIKLTKTILPNMARICLNSPTRQSQVSPRLKYHVETPDNMVILSTLYIFSFMKEAANANESRLLYPRLQWTLSSYVQGLGTISTMARKKTS